MATMNARIRPVTVVLAAALGASAPAGAQTAADTLESWTEALRVGSLGERVNAAGKLARRDDLAELPLETQGALVAELERVNEALLGGLPLDGQEDLRGEDFGEYYMDLVTAVGHFDSREARTALIPAVAVSMRTRQRVAPLGDEAVRRLSDLIARDYEAYAALETLALAWFWADSTGAPLSERSRAIVLERIMGAIAGEDARNRMAAVGALEFTGDPAFLPLARRLASTESGSIGGIAGVYVVPALRTRAEESGRLDLARGTGRLIHLVCLDPPNGARQGACGSITAEYDTAMEHLQAGRTGPAATILNIVITRADQALDAGVLDEEEHALIAGGVRQVLERV